MLGRLALRARPSARALAPAPPPLGLPVLRMGPARFLTVVPSHQRMAALITAVQARGGVVSMSSGLRRAMSTEAAGAAKSGAAAAAEGAAAGEAKPAGEAAAEGQQAEGQQQAQEEIYEDIPMEDEPLMARVSRCEQRRSCA